MNVLKNYLEKHSNYSPFIDEKPADGIKNIFVIPCCNEPELLKTMESLKRCTKPQFPVEIIVVVNSSESAEKEVVKQNSKTLIDLSNWSEKNCQNFKTYPILIENVPHKNAGVGFARKTGMDEAVRRFQLSENNKGIITCLDADSTVATNYLTEIEKLFSNNKNCNGCSIHFEHPANNDDFSEANNKRIAEYELYLRYYKLALQFIGFPYYHFTIGSSFAVSVNAYCKSGGMNKRQAGEDFYFLQKVMPLGNYFALNTTTVYPSPRPSNRVPFGTGAFINQYINSPDKEFLVYNFEAFLNLKQLFNDIELMYKSDIENINCLSQKYHFSLKTFLELNKFNETVQLINSNSAQIDSFKKRFFQWFDAFKILKYLNFAHENFYKKEKIMESLKFYFNKKDESNMMIDNELDLLYKLRDIERNYIE